MKKIIFGFLVSLLLLCTGCGGAVQTTNRSFAEMYPNLCPYQQGDTSPERREALRQAALDVMETADGYTEDKCTVGVREQWVEVTLQISDEWIKTVPEDWEDTKERAAALAAGLSEAMQEQDTEGVLYLSDSRAILYTVIGGKTAFDKFNRQKHYEPPAELDRARIDEILQSAAQRREEFGEQGVPYFEGGSEIVYVSDRSNTIHSIPDCSGMVHYREMTRSKADGYGYEYCENCW